jgi:CubicO group peptidase (beta-lactamase class C family)
LDSSKGEPVPETTSWKGSLNRSDSSGGIYSTNNDLLSFGTSILSSKLLSPVKTRAWMKPATFTSSIGVAVGRPWEIARGTNLTSDGRIVDFYTKTGNIGDYTSTLVLVPDYDLVLAINIAGPDSSITTLQVMLSTLVRALLPVVDEVAKEEASQMYSGVYRSGRSSNSSLSVSVDKDGLFVANFSAYGVQVSSGYSALEGGDTGDTPIRLYPTNLQAGNQTAWRAVYATNTAQDLATLDAELFFPQGSCQSWNGIDLETYGMESVDDYVFAQDENGRLARVEPKAWRLVLDRAD